MSEGITEHHYPHLKLVVAGRGFGKTSAIMHKTLAHAEQRVAELEQQVATLTAERNAALDLATHFLLQGVSDAAVLAEVQQTLGNCSPLQQAMKDAFDD